MKVNSWARQPLGDLVETVAMGPFGSSIKKETYRSSGVPVIKGSNLSDVRLNDDAGYEFISSDHADKLRRSNAFRGDVVVTHRGTLGQVSAITEHSQYERYIVSQSQLLIRPNKSKLSSEFLSYYLRSHAGQFELLSFANQTGVPAIAQPSASIRRLKVSVPPLREQKAIAAVLGALDDKIAANTRLIKTIDELATALASRTLGSGAEIPLLELAEITMGSSPPGKTLNESGEGIVFYQGIRDFRVRHPERRVWTDAPVRFAEKLDTLFSVRAPVGRVNIATERSCIGRGLASLRSRLGTPYTLFHAVKSSRIWQQFNSEGTVFGSINRKQLEAVTINWVASREVERIEADLASLEKLLRAATSMNESLAATRDALLPLLLSGKLKVKEAEKVFEDVL